jgi:TRAP-type C4-dicarboxylate transport system substrate-binding protein
MFRWKVAHYTKPQGTGSDVLRWWCKQLEERSGGRVKIDIYFSEELVKAKAMLEAVQSGIADATYVAIAYFPEKLPFLSVCYIPFLPPLRVDHQVLTMNELIKTSPLVQEELDSYNAVYGYHFSSPFYNLMGNTPIRTVEDFKGVKIKSLPITKELWKHFGAIPVDTLVLEAQSALARGAVDIINFSGPVGMYDWKFYKQSKYYISGVDVGGSRSLLLINKDSWNTLPDDIKGVIENLRFDFAPIMHSAYLDPKKIDEALDAFRAEGLELIEFPPEERAKLIAASKNIQEAWVERIGGEPARQVLSAYIAAKEKVTAAQ